jgi:mannose-1-phosphate guanylyltransferase/mannose-6-phosphate isomerase
MTPSLLPVILCGGSGTRLWPLSRETYPKQFLALADSQTMLQQTATRLQGLTAQIPQTPAPLLVCNVEHRFLAASQLMHAGIQGATILLEPVGRNTAPALTLAALHACMDGADPVLLAMPADHVVGDRQAFHDAVQKAYVHACEGSMATFGIVAERPETGYGYIQYSKAGEQGVHHIVSFAEKPDVDRARQYLEMGNYLWNSGLFMVRSSTWIKAMQHCRPDILDACQSAMKSSRRDLDFVRPDATAFEACPSDSIDYAVMERLPAMPELGIAAKVVSLKAGWSDVGAWDALWDVRERDSEGNALMGDAVQYGCANSLLLSSSRLVAGVGLQDVVVVETPDAILVVDKRSTQDVKKIVSHLAQSGHSLAHSHRKVHRPWGWYDSIDSGERFQVKRIVVNPGASLSLQMHHHRAEHWVVVKGTAEVTNGEKTFLLGENESTFIPLGHVHRLANPGKVPLEIIEVQSGSYLGEDDIVRLRIPMGAYSA